jgi:hypothetical protein
MASKGGVQSSSMVNNCIAIIGCRRLHFGSEVIQDFFHLDVDVSNWPGGACEHADEALRNLTMTK